MTPQEMARVSWEQAAGQHAFWQREHQAWQGQGVFELDRFGVVSDVTVRQIGDTRAKMGQKLQETCYWYAYQHPALQSFGPAIVDRLAFMRWMLETGRLPSDGESVSVLDVEQARELEASHAS